MTSLKRPAEEQLLTLRNPKQPRRAMKGYDGGAPSPSGLEGSLAYWTRQWNAAVRTLSTNFLPSSAPGTDRSENSSQDDAVSTSSMSTVSSVATPRQTPAPGEITIVLSGREHSPEGQILRPQKTIDLVTASKPTPLQTYFSSRPSSFASSSKSSSRTPSSSVNDPFAATPGNNGGLVENAFQSTPKPRNAVASSSRIPTEIFPPLSRSITKEPTDKSLLKIGDLRLDSSPLSSLKSSQTASTSSKAISSASSKRTSTMKNHPLRLTSRQHIYAKAHKATVQRKNEELREQMSRNLWEMKKRRGFSSNFKDFKGLLGYREQLEEIQQGHTPQTPQPSSTLTRRKPQAHRADKSDALLRAIGNAKATIESPKPPRPFTPTSNQLQIAHRNKDEAVRRRIRPPLPSQLPPEDEQAVKAFLQKRGEIVSKYGNARVGDGDINRLRPGQWLNDEVINFYGAMILGRSEARKENPVKSNEKAPLDIFYLSSFFYEKLTKHGYEKARLAKWTKRVDIFSKDALLMPVNHSNSHWTAASINFRKKRIESYDSMYMFNRHVFPVLRKYLDLEHMDKKKKPFDFTGWEDWAPEDTPRQENGFDCGVFTMHFLEALSRGEDMFAFSQKDMPYLRRRMLSEIRNANLRGGHYA